MATASVRTDIAPDSGNNSNCFLSGIKPPVPLNLQTNRVENWSLWKQQSIATENPLEEVHSVRRTLPRLHPKKIYDGDRTHKPNRKPNARDTCKCCGQQHEMKQELCPAWGRVCSGCGCRNHFAVCCKTGKRRVHAVSVEQSDSEDEIVNGVTSIHSVYREDTPTKRLLFAKMRIGRELVKLQLDCGASVNLISARHVPAAELTPSTKILQMWDK